MAPENSSRLDGIPFLASLSREKLSDLEMRCRWRRYDVGEQIVDRDNTDSDVYFVVSGLVQIVNFSLLGREVAFAQLSGGAIFGELAAIDGEPRSANVVALEETHLASLPASVFKSLLLDNPDMMMDLLHRLANIIRINTERIMDLSTLGAVQRVYQEIIRMAEACRPREGVEEDWRISPILTHKTIASHASTTRETVARSMGQLASGGIVERRGNSLFVRDFDRLQRLAGALDVDFDGNLSR
ncbi:MAG: Crp/Fnr family transcriptional regulator [Alphaproteobacteria bacterium]|nr:Crp/Fnr family transcriptional regulator [Alphaproteobacteria bacterium]